MKKIFVMIALLFVATIFLIVSDSKSLLLAPKSAAPIPNPSVPIAPVCSGYHDLTQNILSLLPSNSQFGSIEKIHESYYVVEASNPSGWFWYIYHLGADGLLATTDDNVYLGGNYNFQGKVTEENGLLRLFYSNPSTTSFSNDIFACDLTPTGCFSQTLITNLAGNRYISEILPVEDQDRLYLFLKSGPSAIRGNLYSCSLIGGIDDCALGESVFITELFSVSFINSINDFGVFYNVPFTTNPNNFFDVKSRTSSTLNLANIQLQSNGILKGDYPILSALRRSGTLANTLIQIISMNVNPGSNQDAINQVSVIETLTSGSGTGYPMLIENLGNQFISVYTENNNYVGKVQGQTSKVLHPVSANIVFSPMDVLVDKTVVGQAYDYVLSQNKVFSFDCKP